MSSPAIAWIDSPPPHGRWGEPGALHLPLDDRGLLLADGIFETIWVEAGQPRLLEEHLDRWTEGARWLGMEPPPLAPVLEPTIAEAIRRSGIRRGALRLNWSRGSAAAGEGRGLAIPRHSQHRCWLQLTALEASFSAVRVIVSPTERREARSLLSRCKTFSYGSAIQARRQAAAAGADDALLASSAGGLCCGTAANLMLRRGSHWVTPPLASGCLPGVMRARALALGLAMEAVVQPEQLLNGDGAVLLNSLGCRPISQLDNQPLPRVEDAESFWRRLLRR
jgi:branched-subunit amino acid aminotransferase/4-amino-4-deoxychorismate lyase